MTNQIERQQYHAKIEAEKVRGKISDLLNDIAAEYPYPIEDMQRTLKNWSEMFGGLSVEVLQAAKAHLFNTYEPYGKFPRTKHFNDSVNAVPDKSGDSWHKSIMFQQSLQGRVTQDALLRMGYVRDEYEQHDHGEVEVIT